MTLMCMYNPGKREEMAEIRRKVGYVPGRQVYTTRIIGRSSTSFTDREEGGGETTDSRGAPMESKPGNTGEGGMT